LPCRSAIIMSDSDTESRTPSRIPRFIGKRHEGYALWRVRVRGACRAKGLWKVTDTVPAAAEPTTVTQASGGDSSPAARATGAGSTADPVTKFSNAAAALQSDVDSKTARQMECASSLIISTLGDAPFVSWRMQMATPRRC
jgi:hypothetical protein